MAKKDSKGSAGDVVDTADTVQQSVVVQTPPTGGTPGLDLSPKGQAAAFGGLAGVGTEALGMVSKLYESGQRTERTRIAEGEQTTRKAIDSEQHRRVTATNQFDDVLAAYDRPFGHLDVSWLFRMLTDSDKSEIPDNAMVFSPSMLQVMLGKAFMLGMQTDWSTAAVADAPMYKYLQALTPLAALAGFEPADGGGVDSVPPMTLPGKEPKPDLPDWISALGGPVGWAIDKQLESMDTTLNVVLDLYKKMAPGRQAVFDKVYAEARARGASEEEAAVEAMKAAQAAKPPG